MFSEGQSGQLGGKERLMLETGVSNISPAKLFSCGSIQTMGKATTGFGRLHFINEYLSGLLQVSLLLPQYGNWTRQSPEVPPNPTSL